MKKLRITVENKTYEVEVEVLGQDEPAASRPAPVKRASRAAAAPAPTPAAAPAATAAEGDVVSPLSAVVVSVDVTAGQAVKEGDKLLTLEAMKMNTFVNAPKDSTVAAIHVSAGNAVEEGQPLIALG
ncbi:MAG: biotin/lipoyl-containing protein [Verrucomicrobiota bacterium]